MTIEGISEARISANRILSPRQSNPNTDFADILSERASLQSTTRNIPQRLSDNLRIPRGRVVEQRPCCIICGLTISDEGTCLCEYPTVINNCGISLKHNPSAEGSSGQPKTVAANKTQQISDNLSNDAKKIKLRHKCPLCGAVTDNGNCGCGNLKSDSGDNSVRPKPVINLSPNFGS
ncbi:MAG: hypothetical protein J1F03_03575 [Oscillospiraceae bacterium]|nr:hypothetical protein [Oscillospiraceae bacterium]